MCLLTLTRLREVLDYDPQTGVFVWTAPNPKSRYKAGTIAGTTKFVSEHLSYVMICIDQNTYPAHRLAWLYVSGEWPRDVVDHINGDGLNNTIANLRQATRSQNQCNRRVSKNNKSGASGVHPEKRTGKWTAEIFCQKRKFFLGTFSTFEAALSARQQAENTKFAEFRRAS